MSMKDEDEELLKKAQVNCLELPLDSLISGTLFLSGGRAINGTPVITCSQKGGGIVGEELEEKEAIDLLLHLSSLPSEQDKAKGYTIILDSPKLSESAFTILTQAVAKFESTPPRRPVTVVVVKCEAYDTAALSLVSPSPTCKVEFVEKASELTQFVAEDNLTDDLEGSLLYDHQEWVKYRLKVEPFMSDCKSITGQLSGVIDDLNSDLPSSAQDADDALRLHQQKWADIMNALHMTQLVTEGQRLISVMEGEPPPLRTNPEYADSLAKIRKLLSQIMDLKTKIELIWTMKCTQLTENYRFRHYEDEAQNTICWFKDFAEEYLAAQSGSEHTLDEVISMRDDVATLENHVQYALERCDVLIKSAQEFQHMENYKQFWAQAEAVQRELEQRSSSFKKDLAEWKEKVEQTLNVHFIAHKVLNWCIATSEILDTQDLNEGSRSLSAEEIDGLYQQVSGLDSAHIVPQEELDQLESSLDTCLSPYVRDSAVVALNRSKEIQQRMRQRQQGLELMREELPVESASVEQSEGILTETKHVVSALQGVFSTLSTSPREGDDSARDRLAVPLSPTREDQGAVITVTPSHEVDRVLEDLQSAVQRIQGDPEWLNASLESTGGGGKPSPGGRAPPTGTAEFIDSGKFKSTQPMIELMQPEGLQKHMAPSGGDSAAQAKAEQMSKKRKLIVKELVETEESYGHDLEHILANYMMDYENGMNAINDPSLKSEGGIRSLPGSLIGRGPILFGNMEQLLLFTKETFLPELRSLTKSPMRLGTVFCQYEHELMQYAPYFKNTPTQESLMQEAGAKFFAETQKRIGDPFPLTSYLIKPFQRMTRYALFIKEMIKNTPKTIKGSVLDNLRKAQKQIEFILRHGNDLLAVENLHGVDGGVKRLGKIRRQGDLVHVEGMISKKDRRVFLFEQAVVIAKKNKAPKGSLMSEVYQSKVLLRLNELSMREDLQDQPTRFELSDTKKNKYVFQCAAKDEKEVWLSDLRDLFYEQMVALKEQSQQNIIYMSSKDVQDPIYAYTARTMSKAASRTTSFRHPSRVSGFSGPKRMSTDATGYSGGPVGRDDSSMGSTPRSSKISGTVGEPVYEELPPIRRIAPVPVVPPLPPRPAANEYDVIQPRPPKPEH